MLKLYALEDVAIQDCINGPGTTMVAFTPLMR